MTYFNIRSALAVGTLYNNNNNDNINKIQSVGGWKHFARR